MNTKSKFYIKVVNEIIKKTTIQMSGSNKNVSFPFYLMNFQYSVIENLSTSTEPSSNLIYRSFCEYTYSNYGVPSNSMDNSIIFGLFVRRLMEEKDNLKVVHLRLKPTENHNFTPRPYYREVRWRN